MNDTVTVTVTVLMENSVQGRGLMAEHGLSYLVRAGSESVLFDTGQSDLFARNARRLGADLTRVSAIALSHGHYDHTGGLRAAWELAPRARLHAHPAAFGPHFARNPDGTTRAVGVAPDVLDAIGARASQVTEAASPAEVCPGVFLTGEIPRQTSFEDVGGPFVLDAAGAVPDPIADDQAMYFDTRDGVVTLLGCAHAGVVNTLRHIRRLTRNRPLHSVFGGMHLLTAGRSRMTRTAHALRVLGVRRLGPAHCTGIDATTRLWTEFPGACVPCSVGATFEFQR